MVLLLMEYKLICNESKKGDPRGDISTRILESESFGVLGSCRYTVTTYFHADYFYVWVHGYTLLLHTLFF